jgi:cytochrome o ubiquinol oxidase subunit IV
MSTVHKTEGDVAHGSPIQYFAGFALSVLLTLTVFVLIVKARLPDNYTIFMAVCLAVMQLLGQLLFFLHRGRTFKPRWNWFITGLSLLIAVILICGSLWIINNRNHKVDNMTTPQINQSTTNNESLQQ